VISLEFKKKDLQVQWMIAIILFIWRLLVIPTINQYSKNIFTRTKREDDFKQIAFISEKNKDSLEFEKILCASKFVPLFLTTNTFPVLRTEPRKFLEAVYMEFHFARKENIYITFRCALKVLIPFTWETVMKFHFGSQIPCKQTETQYFLVRICVIRWA